MKGSKAFELGFEGFESAGKYLEGCRRHIRQHERHGGLVEIFDSPGAHPDPDGADPMDPGHMFAKRFQYVSSGFAVMVG